MYVLPISCIMGPLNVVPDFLGPKEASTTTFMAILPRHKQSPYFIDYIHSDDADYDFDIDASWDDDEMTEEVESDTEEDDVEIECEIVDDEEESDSESSDEDEFYDEEDEEEDDFDDEVDEE
jgi:hypothetical protein